MKAISFALSIRRSISVGGTISTCRSSLPSSSPSLPFPPPLLSLLPLLVSIITYHSVSIAQSLVSMAWWYRTRMWDPLSLPPSPFPSTLLTILSVSPNRLSAWFGNTVSRCGTRPQHSGYICGPALWPCRELVGPSCKRENRKSEAEERKDREQEREGEGRREGASKRKMEGYNHSMLNLSETSKRQLPTSWWVIRMYGRLSSSYVNKLLITHGMFDRHINAHKHEPWNTWPIKQTPTV